MNLVVLRSVFLNLFAIGLSVWRIIRRFFWLKRPHARQLCLVSCSVILIACGNPDDVNTGNNMGDGDAKNHVNGNTPTTTLAQEHLQVLTDIPINLLQPVSQAYHAHTGVIIDWLAMPPSASIEMMVFNEPVSPSNDSPNDNRANNNRANDDSSNDNRARAAIQNTETAAANLTQSSLPAQETPQVLEQTVDMLLMHSAYDLQAAANNHQLQAISSETLTKKIPPHYQDPDGHWYGLTMYARTLVYHKDKVNKPELVNYAGLADEKWAGKLCLTPLDLPENKAILTVMLPYRGSTNTPKVLRGWLKNRWVLSVSDAQIIKQIEQGVCDVGIIDSDVFWQYAKTNPQTPIRLEWANQINRGVITNSISAGVVRRSVHAGEALVFMEWLLSEQGQALLAFYTSTYPISDLENDTYINTQAIRPDWAQFKADPTPLSDIMASKSVIEPILREETVSTEPLREETVSTEPSIQTPTSPTPIMY